MPRKTTNVWEAERPLPEVVATAGRVADCPFLTAEEADVLAIPVAPGVEDGDDLQPRHGTVDATVRYGVDFADLAERARLTGAAGRSHTVDLPRAHSRTAAMPWAGLPERVVLLGTGSGGAAAFRTAGAALARATFGAARVVTSAVGDASAEDVRAFVEGFLLAAYTIPSERTGTPDPGPAEQLVLLGRPRHEAVAAAVRGASATWLARDLTNTPSNLKTPAWFAARAEALADAAGLEVEVLAGAELANFGGILAVGAGSDSGPRLVTVTYRPLDDAGEPIDAKHVVLVGKGVTYDTGGLSIKPRTAMVPMKTDMAGAAAALAAVLAAADARVRHRVTAVLPLAENHFGGSAYRPGDVLTVYGGTTVEVSNTDAEGRLLLADALAYADARLDPDVLIDLATLTGAASLGLGRGHGALYASDARLVRALENAADATGERLWHMPLVEDYRQAIDSPVADLSQVARDARGGGSITAALFLREFVGSRRWAHLDIAGPARATKDAGEVREGATGFGARLLLRYLEKLR